jgi:hypothetical protein
MTTDVNISCPHCRRQYTMKVDPERLQRLKMRATCGRCGNSFDVGSRIAAPAPQVPKPDLSTLQRIPAPAPPPAVARSSGTTAPDLADEMAELAREFADAAARFTPVGVRPTAARASHADPAPSPTPATAGATATTGATGATPATGDPAELPTLSLVEAPDTPTNPTLRPPPLTSPASSATSLPPPPMEAPASLPLTISMTADASTDEFDGESITSARKKKSWIDLADPGLAAFKTPEDPAAAALEALLSD